MEHPFESLAKKEPKSDAELITFLVVTRISHHLPISTVLISAGERVDAGASVRLPLTRSAHALGMVPRPCREKGPQAGGLG